MNIAVAGTGRMGTAIVQRLVAAGHDVRVWNRTGDHARAARDAGGVWMPNLGELVAASEMVISFLLDNAAVERVYLGDGGMLAGRVEGRVFIDMSTVSPEMHARIGAAMAARGAAFVECPVSGSVAAAQSGALVGFAGGEAADFARARPLLGQLCRRVELVGPLGAGARMKLAANLLLVVFWQALGEALLVSGLPVTDAARAIDLLGDSNIGATILRTRGAQIVAGFKGAASGPSAFDVDTMRKDLRYMAAEAAAHGHTLPLVGGTLECFDRASRDGGGRVDGADYPAYWIEHQAIAATPAEGKP